MNTVTRYTLAAFLITLMPGVMFTLVAIRWAGAILGRVLNPSASRARR